MNKPKISTEPTSWIQSTVLSTLPLLSGKQSSIESTPQGLAALYRGSSTRTSESDGKWLDSNIYWISDGKTAAWAKLSESCFNFQRENCLDDGVLVKVEGIELCYDYMYPQVCEI